MRKIIRILRRGKVVEIGDFAPMTTLLDYLRLTERAKGSKEGCGEGDCGACTVALGSLRNGEVVYEPVNSCITLLGQADGKEIVTVDDLRSIDGTLHPVQQALVDHHGSQCGFCTPGFVMGLFTLYHAKSVPDRQTIVDHLAGNLCRCTGYRPLIDAAQASCTGKATDEWARSAAHTAEMLGEVADDEDLFVGNQTGFFAAPAGIEHLSVLAMEHPDAVILAGATDVGLWITKQLRNIPKIIHIGRVDCLRRIEDMPRSLAFGSAVTYAEAAPYLAAIDPDLGELLRRLGSKQVRATGTIGGNIANGSPIGDTLPALIALGASIELMAGPVARQLQLEDFFIAYGKQDRSPGEIVTRIMIPKLKSNEVFRCYKVSKRFDQDISAVMGAFKLALDKRRIAHAQVAYGGMAVTPKRAHETETALTGLSLDDPGQWAATAAALAGDFEPINDHRASAAYRMEVAQALLIKALTEIAGAATRNTRVVGPREAQAHAA